jgi:hypothetical protein
MALAHADDDEVRSAHNTFASQADAPGLGRPYRLYDWRRRTRGWISGVHTERSGAGRRGSRARSFPVGRIERAGTAGSARCDKSRECVPLSVRSGCEAHHQHHPGGDRYAKHGYVVPRLKAREVHHYRAQRQQHRRHRIGCDGALLRRRQQALVKRRLLLSELPVRARSRAWGGGGAHTVRLAASSADQQPPYSLGDQSTAGGNDPAVLLPCRIERVADMLHNGPDHGAFTTVRDK